MRSRFICCAAFVVSLAWMSIASAAQIVVAPNGNDAGDGTRNRPFATLERARDAARAAIGRGERVEVVLRGGTYQLQAPLALGAQDSGTATAPVTWRAGNGEKVRLSAGRELTGWSKVTDAAVRAQLDPAVRDRVLAIDLKARGITDYGEMGGGFSQDGSPGIELFVDDEPMSISRYPNEGFINISEVKGATPIDVRGTVGTKEGIFRVEDKRVARWANEKDARVLGYWFWDWAEQRQKIASIDPATLTITLAQPWDGSGYRKGQYFYAFNLLSEIDKPGEWYLDRERGVLYLLPPRNRVPRRAMISLLPSVLTVTGASHITFRDIVVEGAREHNVVIKDSQNCALVGCTIRNNGKWAVRIEGGRNCSVRGCDISGNGGGGVSLDGGNRATLTPAGHLVENCRIHHYSRWNRTYRPGIGIDGVGNRVVRNLIHDAPHQAMSLGGNDHVIELNEIHNVCEETNDAGAIYGWNDWAARGHHIRYNYIHHVYGRKGEGANGVYLDDNFSAANIYGNVFESLKRPIHLGGGRDHRVLNNLFVDCTDALHIDARGLGWRTYGFEELKQKLERWPYQKPPWSERYPELLSLLNDEPMAPKGVVVMRNIMVATEWDDIEGKARPYVKMEQNVLDATRNVLTNRAGQMPRLNHKLPTVAALKFEPIPYERIGLYKSAERTSWPVSHPISKPAEVTQHTMAHAPHSMPPVRVSRTNRAPRVDGLIRSGRGLMTPNEYSGAPLLLAETPGREKLTTPAGQAWLTHDGEQLYIGVSIPIKDFGKLVSNARWGEADGIEVALRTHSQPLGPTFIVQGFPDGRHITSLDAGAPAALATTLLQASRYAARMYDNEWVGEWSIPLRALGITKIQPGVTLGFNLGARRLETNDWLVWTGTTRENWRLDGAGRIVLD